MNIVYVFDKNYLRFFHRSSSSLIKHNPKAKVFVVSPEPLNVENNIVITPPDLR